MTMTRRRLLDDSFKKTVEGNPAIATDSLARMYPGIVMQGWTEQAKTTGAQLLDADQYYAQYKQDDGTYAISANEIVSIFIPITTNMVGKQYTFSASGIPAANDTFYTQYYKSSDEVYNGNVIGGSTSTFSQSKITFTPEEPSGFIRFSHSNLNDGIVQIKDIMLNLGASVLPWEPYTGGQPSPSPDYPQEIVSAGNWNEETQKWEYEINIAGKNLFNYDAYLNAELIGVSSQGFCSQHKNGSVRYYLLGSSDALYKWNSKKYAVNGDIISLFVTYGTDSSVYFDLDSIQLEIGNAKTAYEEPKPLQTLTLTSDRPLTKWDKLIKQNGVWGWLYNTETIVLDDKLSWSLPTQVISGFSSYRYIDSSRNFEDFVCDNFICIPKSQYNDVPITNKITSYHIDTSQLIIVVENSIADSQNQTAIDEWIKWIKNNPITILSKTQQGEFVPLAAAEQEAMNALHTYRPTTVLSNQQGCQMALTYKTRKNLGGGYNLLNYEDLTNIEKWIGQKGNSYCHFDIKLKRNKKYRLSVVENNMNADYYAEHSGLPAMTFFVGENENTFTGNTCFGSSSRGQSSVLTEYEFQTTENPYYFNLYLPSTNWNVSGLHIVFDQLLIGIKLEEVN